MMKLIVLIGYREKETIQRNTIILEPSHDLISHAKDSIMPKDVFYQFSIVTLAVFEPSPTPDIVFKYHNCMECESVELLSSFK